MWSGILCWRKKKLYLLSYHFIDVIKYSWDYLVDWTKTWYIRLHAFGMLIFNAAKYFRFHIFMLDSLRLKKKHINTEHDNNSWAYMFKKLKRVECINLNYLHFTRVLLKCYRNILTKRENYTDILTHIENAF